MAAYFKSKMNGKCPNVDVGEPVLMRHAVKAYTISHSLEQESQTEIVWFLANRVQMLCSRLDMEQIEQELFDCKKSKYLRVCP